MELISWWTLENFQSEVAVKPCKAQKVMLEI